MLLNRLYALTIAWLFFSIPAGGAAETQQILFFNPLVRENLTVSKLQRLRFITVDAFAPFSAFDPGGKLRGIHVDLARAICAELKIANNCTLQAVAFEEAAGLLISKQADVALAGIVPTAQNRIEFEFSVPYFRYPSKFLIQKNQTLNAITEFGVVSGSAHQKMAQLLFPKFKQVLFADENDAISALKEGTLPAFFGDGLKLAALQGSAPELACCELQQPNYYFPALRFDALSATISNKSPDILIAINAALRQMAGDGRLEEIYLRHLPVNPLQ